MNFCKIIFIGIYVLNLGINLGLHGQTKTTTYNFWTAFLGTAIAFGLLFGAGFFN